MNKKKPKAPRRKILKIAGLALALVLVIIAAALVWLRSPLGAGFVYKQTVKALAGAGFQLSAESFEGPLPGRLLIRGLSLSDAEGPLLKAEKAEVRLAPLALLTGTAHIRLTELEKPEIFRLPPSGQATEESSEPFSLPLKIRLDRLNLADGLVHENALAAVGLANPELRLAAEGRALIIGPGSEAELQLRIHESAERELLAAKLLLTEDQGRDSLALDLKIDDRPGGFLSVLLNDPAWPGLALSLQGQGPLNRWAGELKLAAGDLGQLEADLKLAGAEGDLWRDFIARPDWTAELQADLQAGETLAALRDLLGEGASLALSGGQSGPEVAAELSLAGRSGLSLTSKLTGRLAEERSDFQLAARLAGLRQPETSILTGLDLSAAAQLEKNLRVIDGLRLSGDGLSLEARLEQQPESGRLTGDVNLATRADSPLIEALTAAAGLWPHGFGGDIRLEAGLDWRGFDQPGQGSLKLSGRNMAWPTEELEKIVGSSLEIEADLAGGGQSPLELKLTKADCALAELSGRAALNAAEELSQSRFQAELAAVLADLSGLHPDLGGRLNLNIKGSGQLDHLEARVLAASEALATPQGDFKDLALKLDCSGDLLALGGGEKAPDPTHLQPAHQRNYAAESPLRGTAFEAAAPFSGALSLEVADSPGGPLSLNAAGFVKRLPEDVYLNIEKLEGDLAGLKLSGVLKALLGGNPKIDGNLDLAVERWDQLAALSGLKLKGQPAKLGVKLAAGPKGQAAAARLELPALSLGSGKETLLSLKDAALNFSGDNLFGQPDLDLNLALANGLAGPLSWRSGRVEIKGLDGRGALIAELARARLSGSGGSQADGLLLEANYELGDTPEVEIEKLDFLLAGGGLSIKDRTRLSFGDHLTVSPVAVSFKPSGQLTAEVDLTPGAMTIQASGSKIPYKAFKILAPGQIPDGEIQKLDIDLHQRADGLAGGFSLQTVVAAKELKGIKPGLSLKGDLTAGPSPALAVEGTIEGGPRWKADGEIKARLPLTPGADGGVPQINPAAPLSAELKFTGPVGPLWALAGQPDRSFNGLMQIQATVGGSLNKPLPRGSAYLAGGRYEDSVLGLLVSNINVEAQSTPELPLKALLSAEDGKKGGLALEAQLRDLAKPQIMVKGRLNRFSPMHRDDLVAYISGDFGAEGPVDRLSVNSNLTVDQGELDLAIVTAGGSVPTLPISNIGSGVIPSSRGIRSDLKINIPGRFFIRGPGLESEWRGVMTVGGSTSRPSLSGHLAPVRGYYTFAAKEFEFTGGEISFSGGTNPNLNLELTNRAPGLTAILRFGGTASKPSLTMESQPPLPEEEVLSHVLFGKNASEISRFEALQLASAINDLRNFGQSGFNALGMVRSSLGLDVLRLGGSGENNERQISGLSGSMGQELGGGASRSSGEQSDDISVEAGKYLSDNVYVGLEHSGVGGAAVRLEVELAPNVSFEARSSTESSRVGLGWKRDY